MIPPRSIKKLDFIGSFPKDPPQSHLPEFAFVGRSNVGKSSAINTLLGRKKAARVSRTPGRTQLINIFEIDDELRFVDLPGYGFAKVPGHVRHTWKQMIDDYLFGRVTLQGVVVLVDARHSAQKLDISMLASLQKASIPAIVVATKVDTLKRNKRVRQLATLRKGLMVPELIPFSSVNKEGAGILWSLFDLDRKTRGT
jgi:GTP-binding protein